VKEIPNKFLDIPDYNCFGCAPHNDAGLKLTFFDDNGTLIAIWKPDLRFAGYDNIVHGGVQATIIDEAAAWAVDAFHNKTVMTVNLNVNYHRPLTVSNGDIFAKAKILKMDVKYAEVSVELYKDDGIVTTSGVVTFRIVSGKLAAKLFGSKE